MFPIGLASLYQKHNKNFCTHRTVWKPETICLDERRASPGRFSLLPNAGAPSIGRQNREEFPGRLRKSYTIKSNKDIYFLQMISTWSFFLNTIVSNITIRTQSKYIGKVYWTVAIKGSSKACILMLKHLL